MPIDLSIVGKDLPPIKTRHTQRDVMLYALGIGAGADDDDLQFVYENELKVFPTFGVIPPFEALLGMAGTEGMDINLAMLLHGEQYLEVRKHPIPTDAELTSNPKISAVYDKGKGALIELEVETLDSKNDVVFFNRFGAFVRGEGGFGGEKGPAPDNEAPEREPDKVVEMKTLPQQALIYRLSADYNPLHADPGFAQMAGYEKPILHGLSTLGFAARAILKEYADNDTSKFRAIKNRFSRHVFPGETIVTEMWKEGDDKILFRCKTAERGDYCLTNAALWLNK